jgi:lipopolysaccharide biosynthesis protein
MKFYAFYLPQYHPIPENNRWWGKGFTEWTNVTKSRPLFRGHRQPQLPSDLGFYDLRCPQVRYDQAAMASEYGVDGFIYYHYWFHGQRLLGQPLDDLLTDENYCFPFALCWANETWARTWDGLDHEVLIKQEYSRKDHKEHANFLAKVFAKENYIKVKNRPLLLLYRPAKVEDLEYFLTCLIEECKENNLEEPFISYVRASFSNENSTFDYTGCDAIVDFQPNSEDYPKPVGIKNKFVNFLKVMLPDSFYQFLKVNTKIYKTISYYDFVENKVNNPFSSDRKIIFPCCFPSWDNSPRRTTPTIIQNDEPKIFYQWLESAADQVRNQEEPIVFINAWNEWAEGCHLEPDQELGHKFLEAVKLVKNKYE